MFNLIFPYLLTHPVCIWMFVVIQLSNKGYYITRALRYTVSLRDNTDYLNVSLPVHSLDGAADVDQSARLSSHIENILLHKSFPSYTSPVNRMPYGF